MLLAAGCGGDDEPGDRTEPLRKSELVRPAESGRETRSACDLIPAPRVLTGRRLRAAANDSTDLSICDWRGAGARVQLVVDTAPRAQLRFFQQLAEQLEFHNTERARRPRQLEGVGDDSAYGGAGAWWTPAKDQLVAYADDRILRVRVVKRGVPDADLRRASIRVARLAFRALSEPGG